MDKKKILIGLLALLIVGITALVISYIICNQKTPDEPGTITLSQGTQTSYSDISVGLSNIEGDTAMLSIHSGTLNTTVKKQAKAGDTVEAYGYTLKINTVKRVANFSQLTGASQGYIKFVVNKK